MVTPALFITAEKYKQPKYPTTDEWINKMIPYNGNMKIKYEIHTMGYYFTIKRTQVLIRATM